MQTFRKQQGKEQHVNIAANNDIQLLDASTTPRPVHGPEIIPSPPNLNWLNANISTAANTELSNKLLPVEDFSTSGLDKKRQRVVEAAVHSWKAYEEHAWGFDELQPLTQDGKETLGGLGATIVDSLDTLWLMGLKDEFGRLVLPLALH